MCLTLCHFVLVFFSPSSIAITSLGEERANLSAFRTFVQFVLVWICRFLALLVSGNGCGLLLWHTLKFSLTFFTLSYFVLVYFSPISIAITLLGEERANLIAFHIFVRFVLFWFCRFPLSLGIWDGLRFMIVALPGLLPFFRSTLFQHSDGDFNKRDIF